MRNAFGKEKPPKAQEFSGARPGSSIDDHLTQEQQQHAFHRANINPSFGSFRKTPHRSDDPIFAGYYHGGFRRPHAKPQPPPGASSHEHGQAYSEKDFSTHKDWNSKKHKDIFDMTKIPPNLGDEDKRQEINRQYKKLALRFHPDRRGPEADTVAMQHITRARDELLEPLDAKRAAAAREAEERAHSSHSGENWASFDHFQ